MDEIYILMAVRDLWSSFEKFFEPDSNLHTINAMLTTHDLLFFGIKNESHLELLAESINFLVVPHSKTKRFSKSLSVDVWWEAMAERMQWNFDHSLSIEVWSVAMAKRAKPERAASIKLPVL